MIAPFTRGAGLFFSVVLHAFIILSCPLGAVQEWNVCNVSFGFFLYYVSGWNNKWMIFSEWNQMDALLQFAIVAQCLVIPLCCNLWVDAIDFLIGYRYYAGNWEQGLWMVKKDTLDNIILPNMKSRNLGGWREAVKKDESINDNFIGSRLVMTPTGKSFLNIFRKMFEDKELVKSIGYKLNMKDYLMFDEYAMTSYMYGWSWHWNSTNMRIFKEALKENMEANRKLKKSDEYSIDAIDKYDVICVYIYSIPTLYWVLGQEASFHYDVYDFNYKKIDSGRFTVKYIDSLPQFK